MRVLHLLNELKPSGAEVMLRVAADHWRRAGVASHVLSTGPRPGPYAPVLAERGYRVHHIPFRKSPAFFLELRALLGRERFDVVHLHSERANFYLGLLARASGVPRVVRTIHSNFAFTGFLGLRRRAQRALLRALGVEQVSISPSVQATEEKFFGNRTTLISNWYDSERFVPTTPDHRNQARAALGIPEDTLAITTVGNCEHVKNHPSLIRALAAVKDDVDFVYLHVGAEEDGCPERKLAEQLGIADRCRFFGYCPDTRAVLAATDLYAMVSFREGFSIAALEAMGSGLPMLLTDVPGLRDLRPLSNAILWGTPESASLAEAIGIAARLPTAELHRRGSALHAAVRERFAAKRGVRAYMDLYGGGTCSPSIGTIAAVSIK
jgi:glycosyltransferase involved in cell wall biosynthesis